MSFTLRVVFEGVLGWVPDRPFFEQTKCGHKPGAPKNLTVLVPHMLERSLAGWEREVLPTDLRYRASHFPLLLVNPRDVYKTNGLAPNAQFQHPRTGAQFSAYLLNEVELQLPRLAKGDSLTFESTVSTAPRPPQVDGKEHRSLWWLPRLSSIAPDAKYACKGLLKKPPRLFKDLGLTARITTRGGHLSTVGFNNDGLTEWQFASVARNATTKRLEVGNEGMWECAVGNRFALEGKRKAKAPITLISDQITQKLVLKPQSTLQKLVEITIVNMEPEVLFLGEETPFGPYDLPDPDFEPFYALSSKPTTKPLVPVGPSGGVGPRDKPCASGAFDGYV